MCVVKRYKAKQRGIHMYIVSIFVIFVSVGRIWFLISIDIDGLRTIYIVENVEEV